MKLYCATTNQGKLREFRLAAERSCPAGIQIAPVPGLSGIAPFEEKGSSFEENAVSKALYYSAHVSGLVFADDSGLEVDSLGGDPGVRSARFAGEAASDQDNNTLLLEKLGGIEDRTARFVCVIAIAREKHLVKTYRGVVEGRILNEPRGTSGFGYDPLFYYEPNACSFGELSGERKLEVSHRGIALQAMLSELS